MNTTTKTTKSTKTQAEYLTIAQKAIATSIARGATLFTKDGYSINPIADAPGVYRVARSENDARPLREGEKAAYEVDICHQECECRQFHFRGQCKHGAIRLVRELREAEMKRRDEAGEG